MSRFTRFNKSTQNKQNKFKNDDRKKNSRWDNLKTNEDSFSKDSNNFSKDSNKFSKDSSKFSNRSNFKGRWRNKRIYKSNMSKNELDKKMALRGSRQMGISFDDIVKKNLQKKN